ncbi:MAG: hypothetical protein U0869_07770 [Chloroflexota bacterium]
MRRVWVSRDEEVTGSMVSTWLQSWGVSRDERTRTWTVYERRDDRGYSDWDAKSEIGSTSCATADEAVLVLMDEEAGMSEEALLEAVRAVDHPAMRELEAAVLRQRGS